MDTIRNISKSIICVCLCVGTECVLPADAALPGQGAAGRSWRRLISVVEIRAFQVQNHLRNER